MTHQAMVSRNIQPFGQRNKKKIQPEQVENFHGLHTHNTSNLTPFAPVEDQIEEPHMPRRRKI